MNVRVVAAFLTLILELIPGALLAGSAETLGLDSLLSRLRRQLDDVRDHPIGVTRHTIRYDLRPIIGIESAVLNERLGPPHACDEGDGMGGSYCIYLFYSLGTGLNEHDAALEDHGGWVIVVGYKDHIVRSAYWRHDK